MAVAASTAQPGAKTGPTANRLPRAAYALGAAIAYVQWDVARHDCTGRPSALTRRVATAHATW